MGTLRDLRSAKATAGRQRSGAEYSDNYCISVQLVKDYFKWFGSRAVARGLENVSSVPSFVLHQAAPLRVKHIRRHYQHQLISEKIVDTPLTSPI